MEGTCALYGTNSILVESHIIPKFVFKYFRKTGSNYIRRLSKPNSRLQDGDKMYLLSKEAEAKFSKSERWFAENVFKPYQNDGIKRIGYDDNLFYFVTSVLWRVLLRETKSGVYNDKPYFGKLLKVELEWRNFLSNYSFPYNFNGIHILLTDRIMYHDLSLKGVDYYMSRCIDSTIVSNPEGTYTFVYTKFLKFILFGFVVGGLDQNFIGTKIHPTNGYITVPQYIYDQEFLGFFPGRIKEINNLASPSENQQKVIDNECIKDLRNLHNTDAWQSLLNDWTNLDPE
ncbi:hypothetical protein [Algoriphagus sp. Y33]|uniref:hypothetical protein n=1 Tax=Algoriphagus sp. Y33 TaxID=2772483 RepID=UPI0017812839|nr:hypothetical protein [Algoriphagus sp. Y33]